MVRNVHEREIPVPASALGPLIDRLGGPDDRLWPAPEWEPMVLDRPVAVGADGGHGPIRYRVTRHEPGRLVEFTFTPSRGFDGTHTLSVEPAGPRRCALRHVARARLSGPMLLGWPLGVRWLHDAVLEDLLDRAESALGVGPSCPSRWSWWVRLLRRLGGPRATATEVPTPGLLDSALPWVDWSDAYAVPAWRGMPEDPQVWADAIFRDPPGWVVGLLGLRQALVGLFGIARGDASSFDTLARAGDEVLLGTDERHLDFRVSVRRESRRVVLSTAVTLHGRRGRWYSAVIRPVHPSIVRAMLARAQRRLAETASRSARAAGHAVVGVHRAP